MKKKKFKERHPKLWWILDCFNIIPEIKAHPWEYLIHFITTVVVSIITGVLVAFVMAYISVRTI